MASGVKIDPACKAEFHNIKMNHLYRYFIMRLSEDMKSIIVEKKANPDVQYDEFVSDMKAAEAVKQCRYCVYDMGYVIKGVQKNKLVFIYWGPDTSSIKQKMVYSASIQALLDELRPGIAINVEAHDEDDLVFQNILDRLLSTDRQ